MQAELETQKVDQQHARQEQTNRSATWVANPTDATPATEARGTDPRSYRALEDALRVALAERDVALKERDIARAERDIVRMERDRALAAQQSTTYHHEQFDESKFYENRRSRES
jgi:hypothetical protein